jgi:hypothetical protein
MLTIQPTLAEAEAFWRQEKPALWNSPSAP